MTYMVRKPLFWSLAISIAVAGICFGFAIGRASSPGVTDEDLVPAGVNNCVTAIVGRLVALDPDSIVAFTPAEIAELRVLPERCTDPDVAAALGDEYPALLEKLQTIGT